MQNNISTNCVIGDSPKQLYSSCNPEPSKGGCDYSNYSDYEEGSDELFPTHKMLSKLKSNKETIETCISDRNK